MCVGVRFLSEVTGLKMSAERKKKKEINKKKEKKKVGVEGGKREDNK